MLTKLETQETDILPSQSPAFPKFNSGFLLAKAYECALHVPLDPVSCWRVQLPSGSFCRDFCCSFAITFPHVFNFARFSSSNDQRVFWVSWHGVKPLEFAVLMWHIFRIFLANMPRSINGTNFVDLHVRHFANVANKYVYGLDGLSELYRFTVASFLGM